MGSAQSLLPVAVIVAGAAAYGYVQQKKPAAVSQGPSTSTSTSKSSTTSVPVPASAPPKKQKQKKKAANAGAEASVSGPVAGTAPAQSAPNVVTFPPVIPGGFDTQTPSEQHDVAERPKPKKKKKGKKTSSSVPADAQSESSATAPESSVARKPAKKPAASAALDEDGWMKVGTKKKSAGGAKEGAPAGTSGGTDVRPPLGVSTSDAGITTSVTTGNSSPVFERTEDESILTDSPTAENRRTLAERLLPKPRKTGVEDLLEKPDYPELSRVMRIKPRSDEQPATGFSWGDYEDVDSSRATADDADREDDSEWGVVKSRGRPKPNKTPSQPTPAGQKAPETLTKKQRQRAAQKSAEAQAKSEAEAERLATLAKHKRELERARMAEQAKVSKKATSGGMSAYVDENGKLVWQ